MFLYELPHLNYQKQITPILVTAFLAGLFLPSFPVLLSHLCLERMWSFRSFQVYSFTIFCTLLEPNLVPKNRTLEDELSFPEGRFTLTGAFSV